MTSREPRTKPPHYLQLVQDEEKAAPKSNRYCQFLDIAVPNLANMLTNPGLKLFHLMVLALLEQGEPMSLAAITQRLDALGVTSKTGDLAGSLQKAWHGSEPVFRDPDGRYALDLESRELEYIMLIAHLRFPEAAPPPPPPPDLPPKSPFEPLSPREIEDAFKDASLYSFPISKQTAAVLEAHGPVLPLSEVDGILASLSKQRHAMTLQNVVKWRTPLLTVSQDGIMTLNPQAQEMHDMRRAVRKLAAAEVVRRAKGEYWQTLRTERQSLLAEKDRRDAIFAATIRRAVVYAHFEKGQLLAASLLDCDQRSITTYVGEETARLPMVLPQFGLLAGLFMRELLHHFALEPTSWRVIDLNTPQKTRRINKSGRTLRINAAQLITGSVGISKPLGDEDKMAAYFRDGDFAKLRRRLESNVKSLFAFYNYGRLHGCVRLRWGFLDENLPVSWSLPGDRSLYDILKFAHENALAVDFVTGSAPGWQEPWSRAQRAFVAERGWHATTFIADGEPWHVNQAEIQAIRIVTPGDAGGAEPL